MPQYSLSQIAQIVGGKLHGTQDSSIQYLITDSRGIFLPGTSLFFAIKGIRHNGHDFIRDMYQKGVRNFVVEDQSSVVLLENASFIRVDNSLDALQRLAGWHRRKFSNPVIAITGSNGKTILKEWIFQALHYDRYIVRSPKSYNSQVGVPLSLWQLEVQYDLALIEAGISLPGEMEKLETMIRPDIGIFTNLGEPHQENFMDYRSKCAEKLKLFRHSQLLIYSKKLPYIEELLQRYEYKYLKTFSWAEDQEADLRIISVSHADTHTSIQCQANDDTFEVIIPFTDKASVENAIHLIAFLIVMEYAPASIQEKLKKLTPVAMRLELKQGINNCTIINDSYNSDLGSLAIALEYLYHQHQHSQKTLILSDILQTGQHGDQLYTEVSNLMDQKAITRFIGVGENLYQQKQRFQIPSVFYHSTDEFLKGYTPDMFSNETILIKGSRAFEFERIGKVLEKKVHETVLEINLNAMVQNLNYFRSKLKPSTRIVAMVKAFSYGSGTYEIANLLQFQRVDYLAVAFADEGVALREAGISMPVMVMNPDESSFHQIIKYQLEPEIYSFRILNRFRDEVVNAGLHQYPVHLKIDTGMHRLGFGEPELEMLMDTLKPQDELLVKSVFSHLAGSDESWFDPFTREQIARFEGWSTKIASTLSYPVLRHILNSAGIERFPEAQFDMVRLGIGLYGVSATGSDQVKQVSTLKTNILQIKEIDPEETVGYSRKFKAERETRVGILPIGYADGLHRSLGNGVGKLWVHGTLVPIIGNICMDMCMIDLTGLKVNEGDEVIVFGEVYPLNEIALQMKTIPYEVLTSISHRVKRVYFQE